MRRVEMAALAAAVLFLIPAWGAGNVVTFRLGDVDGLGFGMSSGDTYPSFPFDNREAGDPAFTDFGEPGETDATFTFTYSVPGVINAADLEFGLAGLEDLQNDSGQPDFDDRLFLDGSEIPGAFDSDYTGIFTYGIVGLSLPGSLLGSLSDGSAEFFFDGHPPGTSPDIRPGDQVSFDYVDLNVDYTPLEPIPEPATLALLGTGAALLGAFRRFSGAPRRRSGRSRG